MVLGGGNILIQSFVAGAAARRLGERGAVILGHRARRWSASSSIGLAPTAALFWVGDVVLVIVAGISFPSLSSLLSQRVGVDQQGQLQGALAILFGMHRPDRPDRLHQRLRLVDRRRRPGCTCRGCRSWSARA